MSWKETFRRISSKASSAVAVGALGGGKYSVDNALGLTPKLSGARGAALAAGLGLGGALVQLKTFFERPTPSA